VLLRQRGPQLDVRTSSEIAQDSFDQALVFVDILEVDPSPVVFVAERQRAFKLCAIDLEVALAERSVDRPRIRLHHRGLSPDLQDRSVASRGASAPR
jgi:hypothetical protein